jgi:hypothetical protein
MFQNEILKTRGVLEVSLHFCLAERFDRGSLIARSTQESQVVGFVASAKGYWYYVVDLDISR